MIRVTEPCGGNTILAYWNETQERVCILKEPWKDCGARWMQMGSCSGRDNNHMVGSIRSVCNSCEVFAFDNDKQFFEWAAGVSHE